MNECNECKQNMYLYVDNELPEEKRQALLAHTKTCKACVFALEQLQQTVNLVKDLPKLPLPDSFHEELMAKLQHSLEQQVETEEIVALKPLPTKKRFESLFGIKEWSSLVAAVFVALIITSGATVGVFEFLTNNKKASPNLMGLAPSSAVVQEFALQEEPDTGSQQKNQPSPALQSEPLQSIQTQSIRLEGGVLPPTNISDAPMAFLADTNEGLSTSENKIVKEYHLQLLVDDLDIAMEMAANMSGQVLIENHTTNYDNSKNGNMSKMVMAEEFYPLVSQLRQLGVVQSESQMQQSVLLNAKDALSGYTVKMEEYQRLMAILNQAQTIEQMLQMENRLTQVITEAEALKNNINHWESETKNPVVSIVFYQKPPVATHVENIPLSFGQQVAATFSASLQFVVSSMQKIVLVLSYLFFPLMFVAGVFMAFVCIKKIRKKG